MGEEVGFGVKVDSVFAGRTLGGVSGWERTRPARLSDWIFDSVR